MIFYGYTHRVVRENLSPWLSRITLEEFRQELQNFQETLPQELRMNQHNLTSRVHVPDFTTYVLLHTQWYRCHCDLYRFLIPGI